ncbi:MAG: PEP-CTERM sorting domain-containing protein [Phycisphaerae bacterium]|nr:PEP-CTERM sorting domain-containing protein [Gemmatimonadaceae bacterium]
MNQHPVTLPSPLGWTNATYLAAAVPTVNSRMVVNFRPGTYTLTFLGQVAGATPSRRFGVVSTDGSNSLNYRFGVAPETYAFTTSRDWQFYLQSYLPSPNTFLSNDASTRQFAVFANSNGADGQFAGEWLVGGEDNGCLTAAPGCARRSDYDYNDAMVHIVSEHSISTVPEPSTYAMMGVGLLVLGGAARRRRRSASTIA